MSEITGTQFKDAWNNHIDMIIDIKPALGDKDKTGVDECIKTLKYYVEIGAANLDKSKNPPVESSDDLANLAADTIKDELTDSPEAETVEAPAAETVETPAVESTDDDGKALKELMAEPGITAKEEKTE